MRSPLAVRPLDLTDDATAAAVHRIGRAAYAVEAELIGFDGIPALRESLAQMRERPLRWLGAVTGAGEIAGFLAWEEEPEGAVCLDRLCVDPAWFRRGLASLLLEHVLTEVFPDRPVEVTTGAANSPAVALYERLGFVRGADFSPVPGLRMASFARAATGS
ncbi:MULTISPECIES: GNAT family N-acetyltransferase [unclassified Streptomyces]|uniref:GNAT family N-acetyltransferase n=1 Tax=unclassified Streptomyces TaxID=2593676 RepID=UPI00224E49C9|nr:MULTISPECIES: GNAT family N-acetyltransferase [unclassified Streptomyces]MCX4524876.1 GNAT family N-acetyltransferase [Streptomyces sp. NBC_01551]MCX4544613.1 GNAT family N-acetyltransferase [Streptomyces sp. NBC_01565]